MNRGEGQSGWILNPPGDTILIVDDEPANLAVVANYLANSGFQIKVALTGEKGLELARQIPPDLILLDVRLPGMDGFEVCRCLKADERTRAVPVIFMTIVTNMEGKIKGFDAGGVDYIIKPFQAEEVLARVRTHLHLRELTEQLEQKVVERTEALHSANAQLQHELAERKKAEETLHQLNLELDRLVLDRTAQLEAVNQELEAFAYSVSHDLRTPLRHMEGFMELLKMKAGVMLDEQSRHYMDAIFESTQRMGQLIDDLLSFSRTGRQAMSFQPVDLDPLVGDIIRELKPDTTGRNIDWRMGDLPVVSGDAALLRIALVNLIANALKFTRPRQEAQIEIGSLPGQEAELVIYVRDNGVGFDMAYGDKLFGVFQRLHRADEFEGTGIGLANVRRIIARHGGRAWAEGASDQGAAFFFSLPHIIQRGEDEES